MDDAITKATADATHEFGGDDATVVSRKHGEKLTIKGGASTNAADLTSGNIAVVGDTASGTLNIKMAKALTGLTSAHIYRWIRQYTNRNRWFLYYHGWCW